jgi:hypothetical protein
MPCMASTAGSSLISLLILEFLSPRSTCRILQDQCACLLIMDSPLLNCLRDPKPTSLKLHQGRLTLPQRARLIIRRLMPNQLASQVTPSRRETMTSSRPSILLAWSRLRRDLVSMPMTPLPHRRCPALIITHQRLKSSRSPIPRSRRPARSSPPEVLGRLVAASFLLA